jgi:oligopeptide transport system ATP-binding protein
VVAGMADKIIVMYAGHVVESAPTREVFGDPRHPYTVGLLKSVPRLDEARKGRLVPIDGLPPDLIDMPPCCPFHPRCTFVIDKCRTEVPPLEPSGPGHMIRCWVDIKGGRA